MSGLDHEIFVAVDLTVGNSVHDVVGQAVDDETLGLATVIRDVRSLVHREVKLVMDELPS